MAPRAPDSPDTGPPSPPPGPAPATGVMNTAMGARARGGCWGTGGRGPGKVGVTLRGYRVSRGYTPSSVTLTPVPPWMPLPAPQPPTYRWKLSIFQPLLFKGWSPPGGWGGGPGVLGGIGCIGIRHKILPYPPLVTVFPIPAPQWWV